MAAGNRSKRDERNAVLASLNLRVVARDVNVVRLKAGLAKGKMWTALPGASRCNAVRMLEVLRAIVRLADGQRDVVLTHRQLAREVGASRSTVVRAVRDLKEACLVLVSDREKRWAAAFGDLPNRYTPVWATLIDIARSQGLQWELFEESSFGPPLERKESDAGGVEGTAAAVGARRSMPDHAISGSGQPSPPVVGPQYSPPASDPETADPPDEQGAAHKWAGGCSQVSRGVVTSGQGAAHNSPAHSSPGARALKSSPRRGEEDLLEEERKSSSSLSEAGRAGRLSRSGLLRRLAAYGVFHEWKLLDAALGRGWTLEQVHQLLADCERQVINGVKKFGAGIVYRHLQHAAPGMAIPVEPQDAYTRAKRDRDLRIAAARKAAEDAAIKAQREAEYAAFLAAQDVPLHEGAGGGEGDPPRPGGDA